MNTAIDHLLNLGLSQNEARCYVELLKESPSNPYRVSKQAGIPTSKVYEVFSRLTERGLIAEIEGSEKGYVPKDPKAAMAEWRSRYERETSAAAQALAKITGRNTHQIVWNVDGQEEVIAQGADLINGATRTISIAASSEFAEAWSDAIEQAEARTVRIKKIAHGAQNPKTEEGLAQRGAVMAIDRTLAFFASSHQRDETLHGAWTENRIIVEMTESFIENRIFIDMMISNHWFRWGDTE